MIRSNNRPLSDAQSPHGVARGIWLVNMQDIKVAITNEFFYAASNLRSDRKPRDRPDIRNRDGAATFNNKVRHIGRSFSRTHSLHKMALVNNNRGNVKHTRLPSAWFVEGIRAH